MQFRLNNKRDMLNAYWRLYWLYCWVDVTLLGIVTREFYNITSVFHLNMVLAVKSVNVMELYKSLCKPFGPPECVPPPPYIGHSLSDVQPCLFDCFYICFPSINICKLLIYCSITHSFPWHLNLHVSSILHSIPVYTENVYFFYK